MNELVMKILLALFNATTSILIAQYFFSLFAAKKEKNLLIPLISFLIFFLSPLLVTNSQLNMAILVLCTFLIALNYKFNIYSKLIFTFILVALSGIVETIFVISLSAIFDIGALAATSGMFSVYGAFMSKIIVIIACILIGAFKNKSLIGKFKITWLSIYILPIATFLVTYALHLSAFYYNSDSFLSTLSVVSLLMLIICNILIFKFINNIHETAMKDARLKTAEELVKQQEKQYNILLENNETIVKLRHDHKNFLVGLLAVLSECDNEKDKYAELKNELETELNMVDMSSNICICGNSALDAIMYYKTKEASAKGIQIVFKYKNVHKIEILGVDMSILLGNAIDNAIEAVERADGQCDKNIEVDASWVNGAIVISIVNGVKENVDVENMKSQKGNFHGFGIINMKNVVNKYNGNIAFSCEDKKFTTIIILNPKPQSVPNT